MVVHRALTRPTVTSRDPAEKSTSTTGVPARPRFQACWRSRTVLSPLACMAVSMFCQLVVVAPAPRRYTTGGRRGRTGVVGGGFAEDGVEAFAVGDAPGCWRCWSGGVRRLLRRGCIRHPGRRASWEVPSYNP